MAIEMANIFRSLNAMLESKERRQQFDVQAALSGMEVALKREQQRIGERQFAEEMKFGREKLQFERDKFKETKDANFLKEVSLLSSTVQMEKMKKSKQLFGSYFKTIYDSYFTSVKNGARQHTSSEKKKLIKDLKRNGLSVTDSNSIANLMIKYQTSGEDSVYMLELAQIYGDRLQINPETGAVMDANFAKGMMAMGMLPSDEYSYRNVRQDFNDLIEYETTHQKLTQEIFDITSGDYAFEKGAYDDLAHDWDGGRKLTEKQVQEMEVEQSLQNLETDADKSDYHMFGQEVADLSLEIEGYEKDLESKQSVLGTLDDEVRKANLMLEKGYGLNALQQSLLKDEDAVRQQFEQDITNLNRLISDSDKKARDLTKVGKEEYIKSGQYKPPGALHFGVDALEKFWIYNRTGVYPTDEVFEEYTKSRKAKKNPSQIY